MQYAETLDVVCCTRLTDYCVEFIQETQTIFIQCLEYSQLQLGYIFRTR